ncbi:FAD-dependent monooxygenase [Cryptosporangium sp. NPDC048952]|uniref:FAD-dependent monooxygenase n=1 Tax=Cryptosporangium sp. NPDC048952 TaxID=3363961 RepID=UPI00372199A1
MGGDASEAQVLVVGAGAVGSILALELAHHGVPSVVVDRAVKPPQSTNVDYLDGRSMELLRRLRLASAIRAQGVGAENSGGEEWRSQGLDEPPVLVLSVPSLDELRGRYAQVEDGSAPVELPQRVSGVRLATGLRTAVEQHPLIDLRLGWTFTGLRVEGGRVVATAIDRDGPTRRVLETRFVAGCDGARSTVRQCLDIPMAELTAPVQHCSVYFRSPELTRRFAARRPSTVIVGTLTLQYRDDGDDTWVGHLRVAPGDPITADPEALLRAGLGNRLEATEILDVTQWDDALAVADRYRAGPVFLVGESAHRFYPLGDNAATSVGDAVDLGWKLAGVLNGWGGAGLLDSYEAERRPRALMDREVVARRLETRRRFGRLVAAGASREYLAGVLRREVAPVDDAGLPEGRAPAVRMDDGTQLFDRLGPQFTLVDLTEDEAGRELVLAARRRGIPMAHLVVTDRAVRTRWNRRLVLVRPDQHIAWRADSAPSDWGTVLDRVSGHLDRETP